MFRTIALTAASVLVLSGAVALAEGTEQHIEDVAFAHEGPFGTFDQFQLQRGLQVYTEVCAACHPFFTGKQKLIDTAGLRRKGKVFEAIEKFSVVKTLQAIADANVVLLLLDATQGVTDQDAHVAGYILESGRAVAVAVNKWDAVDGYQKETLQRSIEQRLAFLKFAPVLHISAIKRQGLGPVWKAIADAHASATRKMSTPVLTRLLQEAVEHQAPKRAGAFRPKLRYAHQGGMNPPLIVIHGNSLDHITDAYKRFLEGRFREHFKLTGTPMRIELRSSRNPFDTKD